MLKVGLNLIPSDALVCLTGRCPCVRSRHAKHTNGRHASSFKSAPHDLNDYFHSTARVHSRTKRTNGMHWTPQGQCPVDSSKVPERENAHRTCPLGGDRTHPSVRWSLGLAMCLRHLHRMLTHCVRSLASAATQKCTGRADVPWPASARWSPSRVPLPELTGRAGAPEASVRSLPVTFFASVSSLNVSTTLCIALCMCVSIFSQIFSRIMLALH
jgi:hypothetical protein